MNGNPYQTPPPPDGRPPAWTPLDEYLWHTCEILADLAEGRLDQRPLVPTTARLAAGDHALAVGPAQRFTWRALSDGGYPQSTMIAFGSPLFVAGSMAGAAIGNASRRRQAELAAQPRWVPDGMAELTITRRAAYHGLPSSPLGLQWDGLISIDLAGPDLFVVGFAGRSGRTYLVQLQTPWASMMFALAALTAFPTHPRLLGGTWLPPDFEHRCALLGRPCRPAARMLPGTRLGY
ncbi:hypothetical protein [Streptantibioticus silvisoli]|uniref:Uncharacterized protein n=1 Tax=Streptantibioticus silvisoli TaxID=2705255 RepID=A0ABT6W7U2_9ACTN|nr:hypothetical protein [Streptantibioticus silvisoli]MDI5966822.1 hypothetical protein [Streptantibioticus silvisoli]